MSRIPDEKIAELTGKKVRIATKAFHHVVGRLNGRQDERLSVSVKEDKVLIEVDAIVSIDEATPEESEFVK